MFLKVNELHQLGVMDTLDTTSSSVPSLSGEKNCENIFKIVEVMVENVPVPFSRHSVHVYVCRTKLFCTQAFQTDGKHVIFYLR